MRKRDCNFAALELMMRSLDPHELPALGLETALYVAAAFEHVLFDGSGGTYARYHGVEVVNRAAARGHVLPVGDAPAAAKMFEINHPHLQMPGAWVEIVEIMPMPGGQG